MRRPLRGRTHSPSAPSSSALRPSPRRPRRRGPSMPDSKRKYMVATDVSGTCTDTVVFAAAEPVRLGKVLSTPPNFADGVIDSIRSAAETMDLSLHELLAQNKLFVHGSTVVD